MKAFLISLIMVASFAHAEKGKIYKNKVIYKTADSKNHPGRSYVIRIRLKTLNLAS